MGFINVEESHKNGRNCSYQHRTYHNLYPKSQQKQPIQRHSRYALNDKKKQKKKACSRCNGYGYCKCCFGCPFLSCIWCDGKGSIACKSCSGSGVFQCLYNCDKCDGSGIYESIRKCSNCNSYDVSIHGRYCRDDCLCLSYDEIQKMCFKCDGTGDYDYKTECRDCQGKGTIICTRCNGLGVQRCDCNDYPIICDCDSDVADVEDVKPNRKVHGDQVKGNVWS